MIKKKLNRTDTFASKYALGEKKPQEHPCINRNKENPIHHILNYINPRAKTIKVNEGKGKMIGGQYVHNLFPED